MSQSFADAGFGKEKRLLNATHYSKVFDQCEVRASHRHLLILARRNEEPNNRLGLVIAKKHVRQAVQRNRIKRITREVFRHFPHTTPSLDIVVLARSGIAELDNGQLSSILQQQWLKLQSHISKKTT